MGSPSLHRICVFLFHFYDCRIWWRVFDLNNQGLNRGVERKLGGWGAISLRVYRVNMSFKMEKTAMAQTTSVHEIGRKSPFPNPLTPYPSHLTFHGLTVPKAVCYAPRWLAPSIGSGSQVP